jgi:type II secretory ATPase GspE/PulE/Tfp pilus assembly ATPase PilB-like protein
MTELILSQIQFGGYTNPFKLAAYILLIMAWIPIVGWVNVDSQEVRTKNILWTGISFGVPAAAAVLWLFLPFYLIGILLFIITVAATSVLYIMHRNSLVAEFERVLTIGHLKSLVSNDQKKVDKITKGIVFVTANKNEVEAPAFKTPEFFGFKLAQEIVDDAIWRRAMEVLFLPSTEEYSIYYKIDGVSIKQEPKTREEMEYLVKFLKQMADIDVNEKRKPQSGSFTARKQTKNFVFRVNTGGSTAGEKIQITRIEEESLMKISEIGLTKSQLEMFDNTKEDKGIFIITGPAGSGVSTTFYACVRNHDPFISNINTIEKKEGKTIHNITQIYYKLSDTGTTSYARRLQTMSRTGPDIIGVAECEDADTAKVITNVLANDKKIIYVTFSAPSVIQAIVKWFKLVPDRNIAIDLLKGISCQRLVRKLCTQCREAYEPNREVFKKFNLPADKIKILYRKGEIEYDKHGKPMLCEKCQGSGFVGRTGIFETVFFDDQLKEAIKKATSLQEIANLLRRAKMLYLQEQAIRKVAEGVTSIDEVIREFTPKAAAEPKRTADKQ